MPNSTIVIFLILIFLNIKVPLILHAKFWLNIPRGSGEKVGFIVLLYLVLVVILDSGPG